MRTLRLKINDNVFDKLIWLLSKFSKDEIEVINEDSEYAETQKYLEMEYRQILDGKAKFIESEELEERLEKAISHHEDCL